jgi:NAD(P)-dependent dehydrogenase (short-subunit alcohol dehydrogenase family)
MSENFMSAPDGSIVLGKREYSLRSDRDDRPPRRDETGTVPSMTPLAGRPAIVTGGGTGVGRGIALSLAAAGAVVAVLGRTEATLRETCSAIEVEGGKALTVVCDVRELEDIERAVATVVDALGGVRILVNNAQLSTRGTLLEITESTVDDGWRSGPLAAFRLMRECHPHLRDGGAVINVSSGAAMLAPHGMGAYAAVKAAMQSFGRAAAVEWGAHGIRVNTIVPLASSPGFERWREQDPDGYDAMLDSIPLRALPDARDDVGAAVVYLASDDARMITGTTLTVDGGSTYLR